MHPFWQDKTVLVTGHTGFKGGWLSLWLHSMGARVIGYALDAPTEPSLFKLAGLSDCITSIHGDVRDLSLLQETLKRYQPQFVFHLAAQSLVRPSYDDPIETYSTNIMGTVNVLEAIRKAGGVSVCQIITTDKCYENRGGSIAYTEEDRLGGYDPYSSSKACAELVSAAYRQSFFSKDAALSVATVRAGNVIGGGDWSPDRIVPDCIRALEVGEAIVIRNPTAIRPWQHVLEPLAGYLALAEQQWHQPHHFAEAWNFGPGADAEIPVGELVNQVLQVWGSGRCEHSQSAGEAIKHEASVLKLNVSKAQTQLSWKPVYTIKQVIEQTVQWYKDIHNVHGASAVRELCFGHIEHYNRAEQMLKQ